MNGYVFDSLRNMVYITTSDGFVLRYDMVNKTFLDAYELGGDLKGIDISPDQNKIAVADISDDDSTNTAWIYVIDLTTDDIQKYSVGKSTYQAGTYSVAFADDSTVLFAITGQHGKLYKVGITTGDVTILASLYNRNMLYASADHSVVGFIQGGTSPGTCGLYTVSDGSITTSRLSHSFVHDVAVSRDGIQIAVADHNCMIIYNQFFEEIDSITAPGDKDPTGVAYSPIADLLFIAWTDTSDIYVYDTNTFSLGNRSRPGGEILIN